MIRRGGAPAAKCEQGGSGHGHDRRPILTLHSLGPAKKGNAAVGGNREETVVVSAFAPVDDEIDTLDLPVIGKIPEDLRGIYLGQKAHPCENVR
jgi:hypothetical protein